MIQKEKEIVESLKNPLDAIQKECNSQLPRLTMIFFPFFPSFDNNLCFLTITIKFFIKLHYILIVYC